jgi:hypothetical protein
VSTPQVIAGFPEFWQQVHDRYRPIFEGAGKLQSLQMRIFNTPVKGQPASVMRRLAITASNSFGAIITLALNGYGNDGMKIARGLFEVELIMFYLKKHPEKVDDYLEYDVILQKQMFDELRPEEKDQIEPAAVKKMLEEYDRVRLRFERNGRIRGDWCEITIRQRAEEACRLVHYETFYRWACWMHHGNMGGLIFQVDVAYDVDIAPSWRWVYDALINGYDSYLRCLNYYDEVATLGFKKELEEVANEDYVKALNTTDR